MAIIFFDDFQRPSGTTAIGNNWVQNYGSWGIRYYGDNGVAYCSTDTDGNYCTQELGPKAAGDYRLMCDVSGTISTLSHARIPMVQFKLVSESTFLTLSLHNKKVILQKVDNWTTTTLASIEVDETADGEWYSMGAEVDGDTIRVYYGPAGDPEYQGSYVMTQAEQDLYREATKIGLKTVRYGTPVASSNWDNILVETLSSEPEGKTHRVKVWTGSEWKEHRVKKYDTLSGTWKEYLWHPPTS